MIEAKTSGKKAHVAPSNKGGLVATVMPSSMAIPPNCLQGEDEEGIYFVPNLLLPQKQKFVPLDDGIWDIVRGPEFSRFQEISRRCFFCPDDDATRFFVRTPCNVGQQEIWACIKYSEQIKPVCIPTLIAKQAEGLWFKGQLVMIAPGTNKILAQRFFIYDVINRIGRIAKRM